MKNSHWSLISPLCLGIWLLAAVSGECFFNPQRDCAGSALAGGTKGVSPLTHDMARFRLSTSCRGAKAMKDFYGYRYYNPSTGRWMSRDPIAEVGQGDSALATTLSSHAHVDWNPYVFVANNAAANLDGLGLFILCKCAPPPVILLPTTAPICTGLFSGPGFAAFGTPLPVPVIGGCVVKPGLRRICPSCPPPVRACTFTATFTCAQVPGAAPGIGSWGTPVVTPTGGLCLP